MCSFSSLKWDMTIVYNLSQLVIMSRMVLLLCWANNLSVNPHAFSSSIGKSDIRLNSSLLCSMYLLENLGIFVGGPELEVVEEQAGEEGEVDLGRGLLGATWIIDTVEGTVGLTSVMTDCRDWVEGWTGRCIGFVVPGSTGGVWVPESECCLPQGV